MDHIKLKNIIIIFHNMLSDVEDVCFRDKYSYNLFKELPNARQAADIVFSMDTSNIKIQTGKEL